jgi:hypothetical protein
MTANVSSKRVRGDLGAFGFLIERGTRGILRINLVFRWSLDRHAEFLTPWRLSQSDTLRWLYCRCDSRIERCTCVSKHFHWLNQH